MDWQSFNPFIPFFASFFGVLTAFLLQWRVKLHDMKKDRKQFLQETREELQSCSNRLTSDIQKIENETKLGTPQLESGLHLLPTDIWESGKASGWLSLLPHETRTKLAAIYFRIECNCKEAERVRDARIAALSSRANLPTDHPRTHEGWQWLGLSSRLRDEELQLKKDIDELLKQDIWE